MALVIVNVKHLLDQVNHAGAGPQRSLITEPLRTCDQQFL